MIRHYLAVAFAKFAKAPFTTMANVLTLALGLACFVAAYGIATYWRSADGHHPGAERLAYVCVDCGSGEPGEIQSAPRLAADLRSELPDLEAVGRIGFPAELPVSSGEHKSFLGVMPADPAIFDLFGFGFVEGSREGALRASDDVVLLEDAARQLFGDGPALGRSLLIDGERAVTVSGVVAPIRRPSFLADAVPRDIAMFTDFASDFERALVRLNAPPGIAESWNALSATTFVRLPPSMSMEAFQARLDAFAERAMPKRDDGRLVYVPTAHPISSITASLVDARFSMGTDLGVSTSAILLGLGALILFVAGVNYANLATAQAAARLKEAGMRKVLGAGRRQLLAQHVVEAGLLTALALGLAVLVVVLAAPVLRNLLDVDVAYFLTAGPAGALFLVGAAIAVVAAVSFWPALTLARARPADALGAAGRLRMGSGGVVSHILVGMQFLSASFLLIVLAVSQIQHAHLRQAAFGAQEDPVVLLNDLTEAGVAVETLEAELRAAPQIRAMTALQYLPWSGGSFAIMLGRSGDPGGSGPRFMARPVGPRYFETFALDLLAGRVFDVAEDGSGRDLFTPAPPAPVPVVVDRLTAERLGFRTPEEAVGQTLYGLQSGPEADPRPRPAVGEILGVVETEFSRLNAGYAGTVFAFDPTYERARIPAIRIDRDGVPQALAEIERVWDTLAPDIPLRARFSDELFERAYAPFHTIAGVFVTLSVAALAISTAGVLAVAVHVAARRTREIGIRKTLGASTLRVLRMLIADFSKPVLVGNLAAWPLAWLAAQTYLQPFADRAPLTLLPFALSLLVTLVLAWIAVSGQAWRAARVRPAEVLRHA